MSVVDGYPHSFNRPCQSTGFSQHLFHIFTFSSRGIRQARIVVISMMEKNMNSVSLFIVGLIAVTLVSGCSVFGVNTVEEAKYDRLVVDDNFELRLYAPMVTAETYVEGNFNDAGRTAFRRLFGYISGENSLNNKIAMTAPVFANAGDTDKGYKIDMTAPVLEQREGDGWRYKFVLPADYSLESAPIPLNADVSLAAIPESKVAVIRFSGSWNQEKIAEKAVHLHAWIRAQHLTPSSEPRWAGYNPPWTLPFLRRNEILISVN